ncbi:hypothetical protein SDC9_143461 [bioreactor metagenome]|uniref:Glycosyl transferase family 1 domain-containing protein n=1 Tax=bioreactor metagenome TaxID=1076179 RepID=A0A645E674_9ZZZZ
MNKLVNIRSKPYIVVEGFADNNMRNRNNCIELKQVHPKICLYAGMLNKLYGLDMLVEGFIKADIDDYVLEIFGEGPYKDELQEISKGHSNIVYRGVADNKEIISREERATLLINPRYTTAEFTKYSFPSKNMEYMASGTPIITTKLQGMPKDYYPHVFLLEDESVEGMSNLLKKVLNISDVDLSKKGADAKKWILDNKNNIAGTALLKKLIIDLHNN